MFAFGEMMFTAEAITFTFGEITFTFGDIRGTLRDSLEDFRVLGISFVVAAGGGGVGTLWVGGPCRGFRKHLRYIRGGADRGALRCHCSIFTRIALVIILEAQQQYFSYRAILVAIVSQTLSCLFLWGIAQLSRDVLQNGALHSLTDVPL